MPRLTLGTADEQEPIEVELFGPEHTFVLKPITRSVQVVLEDTEMKIEEATKADEIIAAAAEAMGAMLAPTNGNRAGAKKLILDRWKSDELSAQNVLVFFRDLQDASVPPT